MTIPIWKRRLSSSMLSALHWAERRAERRAERTRPAVPRPSEDPFYVGPADEDLRPTAPGTLLDSRLFALPSARQAARVQAWQLRFRSTDTAGDAISAVATLMVPKAPWSGGRRPRPLLSYQCAIDSLGERRDPSFTLRRGTQRETPMMAFAWRRGWAVVTSDYTGPRRAYGAGLIAARITLDGIRASLAFEAAGLGAGTPVGLWGYSGGGQATAWAAEQQPLYAPEIRLHAVAAGGVPTDQRALQRMDGGFFSGLALGGIVGIDREYPQTKLETMLNDEGRMVLDEIADLTVDELVAYFPFRRLAELTNVPDLFDTEPARATATALTLGQHRPTAPVYLYHAVHDQLVPIDGAAELVARYRAERVDVTFRRIHLAEHLIGVVTTIPSVLRFLRRRLEG